MDQYRDRIKYVAVAIAILITFILTYFSFHRGYYPVVTQAKDDKLSGKKYTPVASDINPYTPYFVGFDELVNRGVSRDEIRYINDVLTNFALYRKNIYKAKISYVKDSFERDYKKSLTTTYRFEFGINDSNIHEVSVTANTFSRKISIKIFNEDSSLFNRDFDMLLKSDDR